MASYDVTNINLKNTTYDIYDYESRTLANTVNAYVNVLKNNINDYYNSKDVIQYAIDDLNARITAAETLYNQLKSLINS